MEIKYFNDGFVGKAVFNANEAIKCFNAGMEIRDTEGEYFLFESVDGSEPSESESVNLILGSLQENGKVYVGVFRRTWRIGKHRLNSAFILTEITED